MTVLLESTARIPLLAEKFADKLWSAYQADGDLPREVVGLSKSPDGITKLVSFMAEQDPTPGLKYLNWMVLRYCQRLYRMEDLAGQRERLAIFDKLVKARRIDKRDIMQYRSWSEVFNTIKPYLDGDLAVNVDQATRMKMRQEPMARVLHDDKSWTVIQPLCWEAERYWGSNTNWCTVAAQQHWDTYTSLGPLYIFINHETKQRAQLCFEAMQFMDEADTALPASWWKTAQPLVNRLFSKQQLAYLAAAPEEAVPLKFSNGLADDSIFDAFTPKDSKKFYDWDYFRNLLTNMPVGAQYALLRNMPMRHQWAIVLTTNLTLHGFKKLVSDEAIERLDLDLVGDDIFPVKTLGSSSREVRKRDLIDFNLPESLMVKIIRSIDTDILLEAILFTEHHRYIRIINEELNNRTDYADIDQYRMFRFLMSPNLADGVLVKVAKATDYRQMAETEKGAIILTSKGWVAKLVQKVAAPETLLACFCEKHDEKLFEEAMEKAKIPAPEKFYGGKLYRYGEADLSFTTMTKANLLPGFVKQIIDSGGSIESIPYQSLKGSDIYQGYMIDAATLESDGQRLFVFHWGGHTREAERALINTRGEKISFSQFVLSFRSGHEKELMEMTGIKNMAWLMKAGEYITKKYDQYS